MVRATQRGGAVKIAVAGLHQPGKRINALASRAAKRVQRC